MPLRRRHEISRLEAFSDAVSWVIPNLGEQAAKKIRGDVAATTNSRG